MRKLVVCACVLSVVVLAACKKAERLAFEPDAPIVIENDKGVMLPKIVGKTADGETVEVKDAIAVTVVPAGVVEMQGEKLLPTKNGKAKISAAAGELTGTLDLTVRIIDEVRVSCPQTPCTIGVGEVIELAGQVMGLGAAFDTPITWTTSAEAVAKVEAGKVTGVAPGTATITIEAAGKKHSVDVTVRPKLEQLRLFCPWPPLFVSSPAGTAGAIRDRSCEASAGERFKLFHEVIAGGAVSENERVEWSSSDGSLLVVAGEITPDRAGGAVVTVKVDTTSAEVPVSVAQKKRGAPECDDTGATWTANVDVAVTATLADKPFEGKAALRCQGRAGTDCAEGAYGELTRALPTFGVDVDTGTRLFSFFTEETMRRCCCAKQ